VNPGYASFALSFEISPITLVGGLAQSVPGGMLPIISLTQPGAFPDGVTAGGDVQSLNDYFAHFKPAAGSELIAIQLGKYPFANQFVAANAIIVEPLRFSMMMICPVKGDGSYSQKLSIISSLQQSLAQHAISGGTYNVAFPFFFYTNAILLKMFDASDGSSEQTSVTYQMDFEQPLLTLEQAQAAENTMMSQFSNGSQIDGQPAWSNLSNAVGQPQSLAGPPIIPGQQGLVSSGISGPQ